MLTASSVKICVKMGASWSAQGFKQACVSPPGPSAFLLLYFLKTWRTLIQVFSKLLIHLSAGGWCPVLGDGLQAFPH